MDEVDETPTERDDPPPPPAPEPPAPDKNLLDDTYAGDDPPEMR